MEPPLPKHTHNSRKKRLFSGSGSAPFMDPDVVEIAPPISRTSKLLKHKEVILREVIDIDKDNDFADVMAIDEKVYSRKKGKAIENGSDGYGNHQSEEALSSYPFGPTGVKTLGSENGVESSKNFAPGSHNLINIDGYSPDLLYDDEYIDFCSDDLIDVDHYAILQAHFDNVNIPPGVEASVPWFPDPAKTKKKPGTGSSSFYSRCQLQSDAVGKLHGIDLSYVSSKTAQSNLQPTSVSSSSLQAQLDAVSHPLGVELSSPWSLSQAVQNKKKSAGSQHRGSALNLPFGVESSKSRLFLEPPSQSKKKLVASSTAFNHCSLNQSGAMKLPLGVEPPLLGAIITEGLKKKRRAAKSSNSSFPPQMATLNHPSAVEDSFMSWWDVPPFNPGHIHPEDDDDILWVQDSTRNQTNVGTAGSSTSPDQSSSSEKNNVEDDIMRKFQLFKQFDTVEDYSDHHYNSNGYTMKQASKSWSKRIQEEWKILEKDLPDTIFVRIYESRMDLLRAVIIGAEGTPYHDGLFFFDVFFPCGYPNVPPHVYYHSGGLRLNPNLYNCGKVCLSLLNTWSGDKNEMWLPGESTMLQVLVSIQGLILNQKPYFNEPGYAHMSGSANGEMMSQKYNEDIFILSLRTMLYTMRRPPKHFEDLVVGHFCKRACDILVACKAYMDGAQVGCLVTGGVQDVEMGDKSCSQRFKENLSNNVDVLVKYFTKIGAKGCERFLSPAKKEDRAALSMPKAAT